VLGKLKAELRAHVYAVLEKGESRTPSPLRDFLTTTSGRLVASLVRYLPYVFVLCAATADLCSRSRAV
jgi:hypothetical protein